VEVPNLCYHVFFLFGDRVLYFVEICYYAFLIVGVFGRELDFVNFSLFKVLKVDPEDVFTRFLDAYVPVVAEHPSYGIANYAFVAWPDFYLENVACH